MKKVPKLRFPEFEGEWEEKELKEVVNGFEYGMNAASKDFDGVNKYIRITDINHTDNKYDYSNVVSPDAELDGKYLVKENDILLARTGASTGKTYLYNKMDRVLYFAGFLIRANINKKYNSKFVFQQTLTEKYNKWVKITSMRSGQPGINSQEYASYSFYCPKIKEQEKIASFFSLIDKKIQNQQEKIETLEEYKKGMIQKIFSQEIRFKDENGEEFPEWEECILDEILIDNKHPVAKPKNGYERLGLRSHCKGTFHQYIEDENSISVDTLYRVECNNLIVNITFAWEHAIAITTIEDEGKLVSHRFPTYRFVNGISPIFMKYLISRKRFKYDMGVASPGGAGRNRVLNTKLFKQIPIIIPNIKEQEKIGDFLSRLNKKVEIEKQKLEHLKVVKKGLLQQMFL
ncbi:MAG: restriction endonuclease subunit S [Eubacteriaceae bacterium]